MGRAPCCDKSKVKRGPWSPEEDTTLKNYVQKHGTAAGSWIALPQKAGLKRCGKSCRLRWLNYLRPNIKHGGFTKQEDSLILSLYHTIGSRWSVIASQLPGRTDNDVKNYWNTKLKKRLAGTTSSYNPLTAAATTSFITSTNSNTDAAYAYSRINSQLHNMLPYFPVNHDATDSYQQILDSQIPLPALVQSPENDFALLPSAPPPTLSPPFEFGCGLMPYDLINAGFDFHQKFDQEFSHFDFGYSPSNVYNAAQEQQTIDQSFTY